MPSFVTVSNEHNTDDVTGEIIIMTSSQLEQLTFFLLEG